MELKNRQIKKDTLHLHFEFTKYKGYQYKWVYSNSLPHFNQNYSSCIGIDSFLCSTWKWVPCMRWVRGQKVTRDILYMVWNGICRLWLYRKCLYRYVIIWEKGLFCNIKFFVAISIMQEWRQMEQLPYIVSHFRGYKVPPWIFGIEFKSIENVAKIG